MSSTEPAKVALTRITIAASPDKVYEKLAQVKSWNEWHKSAWVVRAPGQGKLLPGDRFSYAGTNFVMGNVQAEVSEASPSKALEWDDRALFGLVHGGHKWRLSSTGKKRLFGLVGQARTQVTLDHEVTGFGQLLVSEKGMAKHGATWLLELKDAVEGVR